MINLSTIFFHLPFIIAFMRIQKIFLSLLLKSFHSFVDEFFTFLLIVWFVKNSYLALSRFLMRKIKLLCIQDSISPYHLRIENELQSGYLIILNVQIKLVLILIDV